MHGCVHTTKCVRLPHLDCTQLCASSRSETLVMDKGTHLYCSDCISPDQGVSQQQQRHPGGPYTPGCPPAAPEGTKWLFLRPVHCAVAPAAQYDCEQRPVNYLVCTQQLDAMAVVWLLRPEPTWVSLGCTWPAAISPAAKQADYRGSVSIIR